MTSISLFRFHHPLQHFRYSSVQIDLSCPIISTRVSRVVGLLNSRRKNVIAASGSDSKSSKRTEESMFMDENGVVDDMDGYLNHLSLEYDSVWDTKPSWCQPWTITLTGVSVIACSWLILHSVAVTTVVSFLIGSWWYIFLYSYPKAYSEMIAERRQKVSSGAEDTYGMRRRD